MTSELRLLAAGGRASCSVLSAVCLLDIDN